MFLKRQDGFRIVPWTLRFISPYMIQAKINKKKSRLWAVFYFQFNGLEFCVSEMISRYSFIQYFDHCNCIQISRTHPIWFIETVWGVCACVCRRKPIAFNYIRSNEQWIEMRSKTRQERSWNWPREQKKGFENMNYCIRESRLPAKVIFLQNR